MIPPAIVPKPGKIIEPTAAPAAPEFAARYPPESFVQNFLFDFHKFPPWFEFKTKSPADLTWISDAYLDREFISL